jgi:hypothetical protein
VLKAEEFPAGVSDLDSGLSNMKIQDLTHC